MCIYYFCSQINKNRESFAFKGIAGIWKNRVAWIKTTKKKHKNPQHQPLLPGDQPFRNLRLPDLNDAERVIPPPPAKSLWWWRNSPWVSTLHYRGWCKTSKEEGWSWCKLLRNHFWEFTTFQTLCYKAYIQNRVINSFVFTITSQSIGIIIPVFQRTVEKMKSLGCTKCCLWVVY